MQAIKMYYTAFILVSFLFPGRSCQAQTLVGKWSQISSKQYLTDQGAKSYGKSVLETDNSETGTVTYDFKSDHTYSITSGNVADQTLKSYNGTWSLTEMELTMTSNGNSIKSKVNVGASELTIETAYPNSKITKDVIVTFKRA
jgi:hypothetical protein